MSGARPGARPAAGAALLVVAMLALAAWAAVLFGSVRQTPGWEGWLAGVFGGGFLALLLMGAGAWAVMLLVVRPARRASEPADPIAIDDELGAILAELEAARLDTQRRINVSAVWRVPVGVGLAVGAWVASQFGDDPADVFDLVMFMGAGALGGYAWAAWRLSEAYRRAYKEKVLPKIASRFGELAWRPAQPPLDDFRRHRIFPDWDDAKAEDEIFGTYRGLGLSIIELKLTKGSGKNERTVFRGLTAAVDLPRGLSGVTVVAPDRGAFGNFAERLRGGPCQPVRLEDPEFEKAYEVYGSDQISARALLTPAFMERFLILARSGHFGAPAALVQGNRLLMALDAGVGGDLFEPPSFRKPAAAREALSRLHRDIEAVLRAADAVIDLDQAARLQPGGVG